MSVKKVYIAVVILTVLGFGLFLINVQLVYALYGYSPDLIGSDNFDAFQAIRDTYPMRVSIFQTAVAIDFVCFIFSLVVIFLGLKISPIFAYITCCLSLLLLCFYGLAYMLGQLAGAICC